MCQLCGFKFLKVQQNATKHDSHETKRNWRTLSTEMDFEYCEFTKN